MIPKRIFYLWCGSPKPYDVKMCLLSWHEHLPDYEICEINEKKNPYFNFNEQRRNNAFFDFVCRNKMWAYVADYVRFCVLEEFGGIWLDTDIQVLNSFDRFLNNAVFFGCENISAGHVETAVIGASAHHQLLQDILYFIRKKSGLVISTLRLKLPRSVYRNTVTGQKVRWKISANCKMIF